MIVSIRIWVSFLALSYISFAPISTTEDGAKIQGVGLQSHMIIVALWWSMSNKDFASNFYFILFF